MILVDTALRRLEDRGEPIGVALVGSGFMARAIADQILNHVPGMRLVGIANRRAARAREALEAAGEARIDLAETPDELASSHERGRCAVTQDPSLLCRSGFVDAVIEATGQVEFGARVALEALRNRKHLVLVNAELDATVGPILKVHADRAGVVLTNADGDEPGIAMGLFRYARAIGYEPVVLGNIKGLLDTKRTPETQRAFAEAAGQRPEMVASYADGTKLAMEMTILANATGFRVARRGMNGFRCDHVRELLGLPLGDLPAEGGVVDYVLGAEPGSGVFLIARDEHPERARYMRYFKMGDGPLYLFYHPWHLPHLEAPLTVARAVLFGDAAITPLGRPVCEVIAVAKRELTAGETLDGIGGFSSYGVIENADVAATEGLLPMGLSAGCCLRRDVAMDGAITYADVELPDGRLIDELRAEQDSHFSGPVAAAPAT